MGGISDPDGTWSTGESQKANITWSTVLGPGLLSLPGHSCLLSFPWQTPATNCEDAVLGKFTLGAVASQNQSWRRHP